MAGASQKRGHKEIACHETGVLHPMASYQAKNPSDLSSHPRGVIWEEPSLVLNSEFSWFDASQLSAFLLTVSKVSCIHIVGCFIE